MIFIVLIIIGVRIMIALYRVSTPLTHGIKNIAYLVPRQSLQLFLIFSEPKIAFLIEMVYELLCFINVNNAYTKNSLQTLTAHLHELVCNEKHGDQLFMLYYVDFLYGKI